MYNMRRVYEVKTPKHADGTCNGEHLWCGYCTLCKGIFDNFDMFDDIMEFRKWNYTYAKKCELKQRELEQAVQLSISDNIPHWFITCTFDEKLVSAKEVFDLKEEIQLSHSLDGGISVIEYHSNEHPKGGHLHFHLAAPRTGTYKKNALIKHVQKITKLAPNFIDVGKPCNNFTKRVEYVCGLKRSEKEVHLENDRDWRDFHGFPHVSHRFSDAMVLKYEYAIKYALR